MSLYRHRIFFMPHSLMFVFFLLLLSFPIKSFSFFVIRPYSEVGIFAGTSYYLGELNHSHFPLQYLRPGGGFFYRRNFNGHYALRSFINYGEMQGSDANSENAFEKNRNLSFKSAVIEVGGVFEFNFYEFALYKDAQRSITPFIFGGLNYFYFNPQGKLGGDWVDLQPLSTEGQGTAAFPDRHKYFLHQIAIPMGLGVKYKIKRFAISAEWGIRKTFTDYLDDVSLTYANPQQLSSEANQMANQTNIASESIQNKQRGDSKTSDWYVFTGITLSFKLGKEAICRDNN